MTVVFVGRPGVVEMPETIAKENAVQDQADHPADHGHAVVRMSGRIEQETCQRHAGPRRPTESPVVGSGSGGLPPWRFVLRVGSSVLGCGWRLSWPSFRSIAAGQMARAR